MASEASDRPYGPPDAPASRIFPTRPVGPSVMVAFGLGLAAPLGQVLHATGGDWQYSGTQISAAVHAWELAALLAAVLVRGDLWGLTAAWLGSIAGLALVTPSVLSHSPTTAGTAFWFWVSIVFGSLYAGGFLLAMRAGAWLIERAAPPPFRRPIVLGLLVLLTATSLVLFSLPPAANSGPEPAPTAPPGLSGAPAA